MANGTPATDTYRFEAGRTPLLVSMPHCGTQIPEDIAARMTGAARRLPDTDWHVDRLYAFAAARGASVLRAAYSRYVIDLNRAPDDSALYPGADNTGLCPTTCFDHAPVYRPGAAPDADEVAARRERFWRPYHARLAQALEDLRARHGVAVLYEAHTIRSRVPRFFQGTLPDLNLGTASGRSCAPALRGRLAGVLATAAQYSHVVDGRFQGGYITRAYGDPACGVHAVQLELAQRTYMDEAYPFTYREERAARIQPVLRRVLEAALAWAVPS